MMTVHDPRRCARRLTTKTIGSAHVFMFVLRNLIFNDAPTDVWAKSSFRAVMKIIDCDCDGCTACSVAFIHAQTVIIAILVSVPMDIRRPYVERLIGELEKKIDEYDRGFHTASGLAFERD